LKPSDINRQRPIYENPKSKYLYYYAPQEHWIISTTYNNEDGKYKSSTDVPCPTNTTNWQVFKDSSWEQVPLLITRGEDDHPHTKYTTKQPPKSKGKAGRAKERMSNSMERLKNRRREYLHRRQEMHDQALQSSFADPYQETAQDFVQFHFRRLGFLFWDPIWLYVATFLKTQPLTKVFLKSWIHPTAGEQGLVISIATVGALAVAALLYHLDIMSIAEEDVPAPGTLNTTGTSSNTVGLTTSTTLPPEAEIRYKDTTKLAVQVCIAVVSIVIGLILARPTQWFFGRKIYFDVIDSEMKKQIMSKWSRRRKVGIVLGLALLLLCFVWLAVFAFDSDEDRETQFLLSGGIIICWKFVIWPCIPHFFTFVVVLVMRSSSVFDEFVENFVPYSTLDFTMFTATNAADQARQLANLKHCRKREEVAPPVEASPTVDSHEPSKDPNEKTFWQALRAVMMQRLRSLRHRSPNPDGDGNIA